jgi:hypothetical protein
MYVINNEGLEQTYGSLTSESKKCRESLTNIGRRHSERKVDGKSFNPNDDYEVE